MKYLDTTQLPLNEILSDILDTYIRVIIALTILQCSLPSFLESLGLSVCTVSLISSLGWVLQVTECVVELPGLSMGGWPAMGLKDNAVPHVALMTLKCWAITGTWRGL